MRIILQECIIFGIETTMTWNEFRKMIIQKGWVLVRHGGDHDIYKKTGRSDLIVVERHWNEEIKRGLQKRLLKKVNNDN